MMVFLLPFVLGFLASAVVQTYWEAHRTEELLMTELITRLIGPLTDTI